MADTQSQVIPGERPVDFVLRRAAEAQQKEQERHKPAPDPVQPLPESVVVQPPPLPQPAPPAPEVNNQPLEVKQDDFVPEIPVIEVKKTEAAPAPVVNNNAEIDRLLNSSDDDRTIPVKENFKLLKDHLKTTKTQLQEKDTALAAAAKKVEAYEKGELVPEVYTKSQERIQHLERYEKIHALKTSPGYKKSFVEPIEEINDKLSELALSYEIEAEDIEKAFSIENPAELNRFLSSKFNDNVGATEAKNLLLQARGLQERAQEAELEPSRALQELEDKHRLVLESEANQKRFAIAQKGKSAWVNTINKLREEGSAASLLIKNGDPEYVEKHVQPMFQKAAIEYGKVMKALAENGLHTLSDEVAEYLAKMTLLAHDSALSAQVSDAALRQLEQTAEASKRFNPILRPPIGQRIASTPVPVAEGAGKSLEEKAGDHIRSIVATKK